MAKKGLLHGPSFVQDGSYDWPSDATLSATSTGPSSVLLSWPEATGTQSVAHYLVYQDGHLVATVAGNSLTDTVTGLVTGVSYAFAVQAADASAVATTDGPTTTYVAVTPSASLIANPLDRSVATTLGSATSFLYTGSDPIQPGVTGGTLLPAHASVIRGHVLARDASALAGVLVTVVNHPEFGSTLTQADGEYDLGVNGGQTLRLHYALTNYLPVERLVQAPSQDYVTANDVDLVALDSQVTAIDVSSSSTSLQVARGTPSTDSSGTRQATLLVPPGTQATMTLPDASTATLTTMSVRATEYSVGNSGLNALPADLPGASGYAYAVELSADEALAAGATKLVFSQPLALYIENFLGFPVGTAVPSGYYNPAQGAWVPSTNGLVLQIVSVTGSEADVDIDGDGMADTGDALAAIGITDLERQELASLYSAGQALWRTSIAHFTPMGAGPNNGPPADAEDVSLPCEIGAGGGWCGPFLTNRLGVCDGAVNLCAPGDMTAGIPPPGTDQNEFSYWCCPSGYGQTAYPVECATSMCDSPAPPPPPPDGPGNCQNENASTIECQRQSLGEDLPIAGTPYTLHYESDRQRGRQAQLTVPLSDALGGPETGIELQVNLAGRLFTQDFPGQSYQSTTFTWDGRDGYGRLLQGAQPISIQLQYLYSGVYQSAGSFGVQGTGSPIVNSTTRQPFTRTKGWKSTIDFWDSQPEGFGGWTLSVHHTYDVSGRVLRFGNGLNRTLADVPAIIQTIAGNGQTGSGGDGGAATSASVTGPRSLAIGPDGTVYIADGQSCIRKVGPDGIVHTFAGQCSSPGFSGDGGLATSAQLSGPQDLALGPDGTLYIADTANQRIRHVDASGVIQTVAGSGATGATSGSFSGDGGPARAATFDNPSGVDVASDGTFYVADRDNGRIRRVASDATITTVAGSGASSASTGTEGAATAAALGTPSKVRYASDGSFFIAETSGNVVRRVGPEGLIHPVAGTGTAGSGGDGNAAINAPLQAPMDLALGADGSIFVVDQSETVRQISSRGVITTVAGVSGQNHFSGDQGLATAATMGLSQGIRLGPDGSLYIACTADNRVRHVQGALTDVSSGTSNLQLSSKDGRQVYVFDPTGRHLQTLDALTGASLYAFSYDSGGRLATVTDVDGNITQFNHDSTGHLLSLVGPFGQSMTFASDANGYLATSTDPASNTTQFTYDPNGLLQTKTDPRGGLSQYTYDSVGRLVEDQDPAGGSKTLSRAESGFGFTVTETTALGRQTTLTTSLSSNGAFSRTNTLPSGAQASLQQGPSSTTVMTADKTQTATTQTPDPRIGFGMLSPTPSVTTTTPSGLSSIQTTTRAVTLSGGNLATFTEQTSLNGSAWTKLFNAATRTWTTTSPAGRQSTMTVDAAGRPTQTAMPNVAPFSFAYDSHGRLVSTAQGTHTWTQTYDTNGYLASITDALSHTTSYRNDPLGRPTTTTLPDGRQLGTVYDPDGNATQMVLPSDASHAFSYTPVSLLASYTPPSIDTTSPATQYAYDLDRELTTTTRPDGIAINYAYDSAGRLQTTTLPQGALSLGYDPTGYLGSSTTPGGETIAYAYDGFLKTGVTWSGPVSGSLSFGFDNNLRMTSQAVNGTALSFGYDADGLLTRAGALTLTLDTQNGRLNGTTLGSMTDSYTYDTNGLFASYTAKYSGNVLYSESVVRDAIGRITQKTEVVQGTTHVWAYTFDVSGRLTDVTEDGSFSSHYGYDADDNRTTCTNPSGTTNPTYDAQDRLLTYGGATYAYTENGELTSKTDSTGTTGYTYDALGNLLSVSLPSGNNINYIVDGENRRLGKQVNGALTAGFLYQDALRTVAQLDASGNVVSQFVFGSKPNVPDYFTTSAGTFRIVSDHLGSPRLIVDTSSGSVVEEIDYDEFGNVTNDTSPGKIPFGFAGGLYDTDTALVRFGVRDYDANAGRWTSKDPIRFSGGSLNLFGYAINDPVNVSDPNGEDPWYCSIPILGLLCNIRVAPPPCHEPNCLAGPAPGPTPPPPPAPICSEGGPKTCSEACSGYLGPGAEYVGNDGHAYRNDLGGSHAFQRCYSECMGFL